MALTNAPLFSDKAPLFRESVFVIGYDTYVRVVDLKYYSHCRETLSRVLDGFRELKVRFLVAKRNSCKLETACDLFSALDGFENDISSTQLRNEGKGL